MLALRRARLVNIFRPQLYSRAFTMATASAEIESNGGSGAPTAPEDPVYGAKKRPYGQNYRFKSNKKHKKDDMSLRKAKQGSHQEILLADIRSLLERTSLTGSEDSEQQSSETNGSSSLPEPFTETTVKVVEISSTGDGLGFGPDGKRIYIVPFTAPGDVVTAKVIKHFNDDQYTLTDYVRVNEPSPVRDDSRINCQYFASCSGCQFQMLDYGYQLTHKKQIVERAYKNFSDLDPSLIPAIGDTIGSPLEYGYRTKLTPHFDGPPGGRKDRRHGVKPQWAEVPPIGFMFKGTRKTLDIEDCPIGTDAVRKGMKRERARVTENINTYQRGATLLLRESTERIPKGEEAAKEALAKDPDTVLEDRGDYVHAKTCVTIQTAKTKEYIGDFVFTNPAGAFFQNNNSILPTFTEYIRQHIFPKTSHNIKHLIDAYSGSGLFTITLSSIFKKSLGIDIATSSIKSATENATANGLDPEHAGFIAADATDLFAQIKFPAEETVVVIDPPRKGCDESFLKQLLTYSPERVVYVSCNVHTQARDVGVLVGGMEEVDGGFGPGKGVYEIESIVGFDFFPQTGHVEGVAVLKKHAKP